ncbi:MAG: type II toxin-antitoxin system MqsA family antitoxin [Magnetococcus sp. YQC-5]
MTQQKASDLFGGGKNAFQKYESGEITPTKGISLPMKIVESDRKLINIIPELRKQIRQEPINLPQIIHHPLTFPRQDDDLLAKANKSSS